MQIKKYLYNKAVYIESTSNNRNIYDKKNQYIVTSNTLSYNKQTLPIPIDIKNQALHIQKTFI